MTFCLFFCCENKTIFAENANGDCKIELQHKKQTIELNLKDFEKDSSIHTVIWQASLFSKKGSNKQKAKTILSFFNATSSIENSFEMVMPGIKNKIDEIEKKVNVSSNNAKLVLTDKFKTIKESNAEVLDREKLYFEILNYLQNSSHSTIQVPTKFVQAKILESDLKDSTNLRASFKTDFSKSSAERKNNIKKAIASFNGLNIYPGQTISFNKTTGPRNAKNGYQEAKIIVGGEYVAGFGGGVCQASTTIYNACLRAGLDCSGKGHSIPPSYIGVGLDAMVNTGVSDMTITNNLNKTIYIQAYCTDDKICVNVFGEKLDGLEYKPKVVINEKIPNKGYKKIIDTKHEFADKVFYDDESFVKQKATDGFKTTTYLQTFKNGKLINEKQLRKDSYPPSEGTIICGSEPRPEIVDLANFDFFF